MSLPWGTYTFWHEFHIADLEPQCTTLKIHVTSTNTLFKGPYPTQCSHSPPSVNPGWLTAILFSQIPNLSLHAPLLLASTLPTPAVKHRKCFLCLHIKSPRRIWISHFSSACCWWLEPFCCLIENNWKHRLRLLALRIRTLESSGDLWFLTRSYLPPSASPHLCTIAYTRAQAGGQQGTLQMLNGEAMKLWSVHRRNDNFSNEQLNYSW